MRARGRVTGEEVGKVAESPSYLSLIAYCGDFGFYLEQDGFGTRTVRSLHDLDMW